MNNTTILVIGQDYNGINIPIDATTFHYYGHTAGDYYAGKKEADAFISFVPSSELDAAQIVADLKNILNLNVDKDKYVFLRTTFESYESDQRPRISVRLPSGYAGLHNPAMFYSRSNYSGIHRF